MAAMVQQSQVCMYRGKREGNKCYVEVDGLPLDISPDVLSLPFGEFEWGYKGTGPSRLAFAILAHHMRDDGRALGLYRSFCDMVVSELPEEKWSISTEAIESYLQRTVDVPMTLDELLQIARDSRG